METRKAKVETRKSKRDSIFLGIPVSGSQFAFSSYYFRFSSFRALVSSFYFLFSSFQFPVSALGLVGRAGGHRGQGHLAGRPAHLDGNRFSLQGQVNRFADGLDIVE